MTLGLLALIFLVLNLVLVPQAPDSFTAYQTNLPHNYIFENAQPKVCLLQDVSDTSFTRDLSWKDLIASLG